VIVGFVDIGGLIDHQFKLSFLNNSQKDIL